MSSATPAATKTSASLTFWQVMPAAPAATCMAATAGTLWVLMCGRLAMPGRVDEALAAGDVGGEAVEVDGDAGGVEVGRGCFDLHGHVLHLLPKTAAS